jgi:hypothetical protein
MAVAIVGFSAQKFGGVQHFSSFPGASQVWGQHSRIKQMPA